MSRIRRHLTFANVASGIALFVALGGGTAVALNGANTVQSDDLGPGAQVKAPDVAADAVNGSDVLDGSLGLADVNANTRPHKLDFSVPGGTAKTPISTVGNLQLSGECTAGPGPALYIHLRNLTNATGTMNALFITETPGANFNAMGQSVGAGAEVTVDGDDDAVARAVASGNFSRVEGQVVFRTPHRVTTIDFHAFAGDQDGPSRCEFFGTAVPSSLS